MKYLVIVALSGAGVGYAIYCLLPAWVLVLYLLVNLMGVACARASSRGASAHDEWQ